MSPSADLPDWQTLVSLQGDVRLASGVMSLANPFTQRDVSAYNSLCIRTSLDALAATSFLLIEWFDTGGLGLFNEYVAFPKATGGAQSTILVPIRGSQVQISAPYGDNPTVTIDGSARVVDKVVSQAFSDYSFGNSGSVAWTNGQSTLIPILPTIPQGLCQLAVRIPLNPVSGWLYVQCTDGGLVTRLMPLIDSQEFNLQTGFATVSKQVILPATQGKIFWQSHLAATYDVQIHIVSSGN